SGAIEPGAAPNTATSARPTVPTAGRRRCHEHRGARHGAERLDEPDRRRDCTRLAIKALHAPPGAAVNRDEGAIPGATLPGDKLTGGGAAHRHVATRSSGRLIELDRLEHDADPVRAAVAHRDSARDSV